MEYIQIRKLPLYKLSDSTGDQVLLTMEEWVTWAMEVKRFASREKTFVVMHSGLA